MSDRYHMHWMFGNVCVVYAHVCGVVGGDVWISWCSHVRCSCVGDVHVWVMFMCG